MSLKKTDLYKNERMRIHEQMRKAAVPGRFGDQGEVLTPFHTRLPKSLIKVLQTQALARGLPVHELVTLALRAGLGGEVLAAAEAVVAPTPTVAEARPVVARKAAPVARKAAPPQPAAKAPPAKKAAAKTASAKKVAAKKAPAEKTTAKKAVAKKTAQAQTARKKAA